MKKLLVLTLLLLFIFGFITTVYADEITDKMAEILEAKGHAETANAVRGMDVGGAFDEFWIYATDEGVSKLVKELNTPKQLNDLVKGLEGTQLNILMDKLPDDMVEKLAKNLDPEKIQKISGAYKDKKPSEEGYDKYRKLISKMLENKGYQGVNFEQYEGFMEYKTENGEESLIFRGDLKQEGITVKLGEGEGVEITPTDKSGVIMKRGDSSISSNQQGTTLSSKDGLTISGAKSPSKIDYSVSGKSGDVTVDSDGRLSINDESEKAEAVVTVGKTKTKISSLGGGKEGKIDVLGEKSFSGENFKADNPSYIAEVKGKGAVYEKGVKVEGDFNKMARIELSEDGKRIDFRSGNDPENKIGFTPKNKMDAYINNDESHKTPLSKDTLYQFYYSKGGDKISPGGKVSVGWSDGEGTSVLASAPWLPEAGNRNSDPNSGQSTDPTNPDNPGDTCGPGGCGGGGGGGGGGEGGDEKMQQMIEKIMAALKEMAAAFQQQEEQQEDGGPDGSPDGNPPPGDLTASNYGSCSCDASGCSQCPNGNCNECGHTVFDWSGNSLDETNGPNIVSVV